MTERIPDQHEEHVRASLQGLNRSEKDIVRLAEESIGRLVIPEAVLVSLNTDIQDHSVWIDDERIMKALSSLETNAIEAMPQGGKLTLGIQGDEKQVVITIHDTGSGISKENMDRILVPFFTTKHAGEGTGLSLPLAYNSIKMHSGKLEIKSNADPASGPTGTLITITLPRARPDSGK
jgi:signal transduction histidine kinase